MANGKNSGRLFADCTNEHGYGESHAFAKDAPTEDGAEVECVNCGRRFELKEGKLIAREETDG